MPHEFDVDESRSTLRVSVSGDTTFDDRLAIFDKTLFLIAAHDIRRIVSDCSGMVSANPGVDDFYFVDAIRRQSGKMNGAHNTMIFDHLLPIQIDLLATRIQAGRPITVFKKIPGRIHHGRDGTDFCEKVAIPLHPGKSALRTTGKNYDIAADHSANTLYVDLFGEVTFQERITAHDKMLFQVVRHDFRSIIIDLSQMTSENSERDEIYFIDYLMHSPYVFRQQHLTVIHSDVHAATRYTTAALRGIGLTIRDVELPDTYYPGFLKCRQRTAHTPTCSGRTADLEHVKIRSPLFRRPK